jgi:hypothetical protein
VDYRPKSSSGHPLLADDAPHQDPLDLLAAITDYSPIKDSNWFAISDGTPTKAEYYFSMPTGTHSGRVPELGRRNRYDNMYDNVHRVYED